MIYWLKTAKDIDTADPIVVLFYTFNGSLSSEIADDSGHDNDGVPVSVTRSTGYRGYGARLTTSSDITYPAVDLSTGFEINFFARRY